MPSLFGRAQPCLKVAWDFYQLEHVAEYALSAQIVHADLIAESAGECNTALAEEYMALQPMICGWWLTMLRLAGLLGVWPGLAGVTEGSWAAAMEQEADRKRREARAREAGQDEQALASSPVAKRLRSKAPAREQGA